MALETFPVDLAEKFMDPASQAELLNDALETGDAGYIANALGIIARARGMTPIAKEEEGNPRLTTLLNVVHALGLKLTIEPVKEASGEIDRPSTKSLK